MVEQIIDILQKGGRTNNDGGGFDYNQQIQANTNMRTRGMIDDWYSGNQDWYK